MNDQHRMSWEEAVLWLKRQPGQEELVKACFYDDPLEVAASRYWACGEWKAVQRLLPRPSGDALDIGAGRGISSFALAKDGWRTTALEPNGSDVVGAGAIRQLCERTGVDITVVEEWGERLPFDDSSFDFVHCRQVLHHARDLRQLCSEIGRVLRPDGYFIASREHVISSREDLPQFLSAHPLHHLYGGENAFLLDEYQSSIENAGIRLTDMLNPTESEINTFPDILLDVKRRYAKRFHWPFPALIPDRLIFWAGSRDRMPGRLYTFVGRKTAD